MAPVGLGLSETFLRLCRVLRRKIRMKSPVNVDGRVSLDLLGELPETASTPGPAWPCADWVPSPELADFHPSVEAFCGHR